MVRPQLSTVARAGAARRGGGTMVATSDLLASSVGAVLRLEALDALPPLARDAACAGACAAGALAWLGVWTQLAQSGAVSPNISRKMVHVGSAPLFVLLWPFFSATPWARLLAAAVPALNALRLLRAGLPESAGGAAAPDGLVTAVSRSGDRAEVLKGPFIYVLVLLTATVFCWRDSAIGVLAISQMAVGDGLADIVGRRWGGSNKWPFARTKSVAGSIAFFVGASAASLGLLYWLQLWGCISILPPDTVWRVLGISLACVSVELLPTDLVDDNVSVPIVAAVLALALFGMSQ